MSEHHEQLRFEVRARVLDAAPDLRRHDVACHTNDEQVTKFRVENQFGGSFGGPVIKNKTFFFVSLLRWTDRRIGSGTSINGAPTEAGRALLQSIASTRPTVRALLENLPAGAANGLTRTVTADGRSLVIPLGDLTGSGAQRFDDWQYSYRVDHRFSNKHSLALRYMDDDSQQSGTGQLTPVGLTNVQPIKVRSASANLASSLTPRLLNEFRVSFSRYTTSTNAANPAVAERIPSIEVPDLGVRGFNAATNPAMPAIARKTSPSYRA